VVFSLRFPDPSLLVGLLPAPQRPITQDITCSTNHLVLHFYAINSQIFFTHISTCFQSNFKSCIWLSSHAWTSHCCLKCSWRQRFSFQRSSKPWKHRWYQCFSSTRYTPCSPCCCLIYLMRQSPPVDVSLTAVLSPTNIAPLFTSRPELVSTLFPHLPPDLPVPPSAGTLQRVIRYGMVVWRPSPPIANESTNLLLGRGTITHESSSPYFRATVSSLDRGLNTGLLCGFVRSLGLPEEAGTGVLPFLRAIQEQVDRERSESGPDDSDSMETE